MDPNLSLQDSYVQVTGFITAHRNGLLYNFFTWNGAQWDCDQVSRANIIGINTISILNGGNLPPGFQWRDYNNNMVTVTAADVGNMGAQLLKFTNACYNASWTHKANVLALTDAASVQSYDFFSTLWPDPTVQTP